MLGVTISTRSSARCTSLNRISLIGLPAAIWLWEPEPLLAATLAAHHTAHAHIQVGDIRLGSDGIPRRLLDPDCRSHREGGRAFRLLIGHLDLDGIYARRLLEPQDLVVRVRRLKSQVVVG